MSDPNLFPAGWMVVPALDGTEYLLLGDGEAQQRILASNARTYLKGDTGTPGAPGTNGTGILTAKNSGTQTNNSNSTPTSITGLSVAVTSGRRCIVTAYVPFQSNAATTTGIGFVWTGPAMTNVNWQVATPSAAVGPDQLWTANATALATVLVSPGVVATNTTYLATITGVFTPSAGGTLQLQFRSEVNSSQVSVLDGAAMSIVDCG